MSISAIIVDITKLVTFFIKSTVLSISIRTLKKSNRQKINISNKMKRISYFFKDIEDLFTPKITSKFRVFQQPQYMIKKVMLVFKRKGLFSVFIILFKKIFRLKIKNFKKYQELFFNKNGLEIGGPSNLFKKRACCQFIM